jgi:dihydrofolate reductase
VNNQPSGGGVRRKEFKAIAAMAQNRVIGRGNQIPWHLPEDFQWFKRTTMGHVLVMGRRTFESLGRALPGRTTLVLSRSGFRHPDVHTVSRLEDIALEPENRELFICGGAEVYRAALPFCSDLYLTVVKREVAGDVLFPAFEDRFELVSEILDRAEFRILHYRNPAPCPRC